MTYSHPALSSTENKLQGKQWLQREKNCRVVEVDRECVYMYRVVVCVWSFWRPISCAKDVFFSNSELLSNNNQKYSPSPKMITFIEYQLSPGRVLQGIECGLMGGAVPQAVLPVFVCTCV